MGSDAGSLPAWLTIIAVVGGLRLWPTILLAGVLIAFVIRLVRRRRPYILGAILLVALGHWAVTLVSALLYYASPDPLLAHVQTSPPPAELPTTLVVANISFPWMTLEERRLFEQTPVRMLLAGGTRGCPDHIMKDVRGQPLDGSEQQEHKATKRALPSSYLLLWRCSYSEYAGQKFTSQKSITELRAISPNSDVLLDVYYREPIEVPSFPPILTFNLGRFSFSWAGMPPDAPSRPGSPMTDFVVNGIKT